jgi:hypothetical protein
MTALVSVLIPAYNGDRYIGAALASAMSQSHRELEILVGDDGSTDATAEIVRDAAAQDPRIRLITHERNLGAPANQIALHHAARGAYVKPLLQDDLLDPGAITRLVEPLEADPSLVMAFGRRRLIDADGGLLRDQAWNRALADTDVVLDGWQLASAMLEQIANLVGEVSCVLYRRDAIGDPDGMWSLDGHQFGPIGDVALWLKLLRQGQAFYTPEVLTSFRQHEAQASHRPDVILGGALEWSLIALAAPRLGHLSSPRAERQALSAALAYTVNGLRQGVEDPVWSARLRTAAAAVLDRLHDPALQPMAEHYPVAVAAPALDGADIAASVVRLRALAQDHVVGRCVIAFPADSVADAVEHVTQALEQGPDFDLELTPTDAPGGLVTGPWLAVVGADDAWAATATARVRATRLPKAS